MDIRDQRPEARKDRLLVEELEGETLVYDLDSHDAHCLNPSAALIWKLCDGRTTVREMAPHLSAAGLPADERLVWMALGRLDKAGLVGPLKLPGGAGRYSRKEVLRALGATAALTLLAPAVDSVVAPLAAQAASCITLADCQKLDKFNCGGLPICTNRTQCCKRSGSKCTARNC